MLTFLPLEEIDAMNDWQGSQLNTAKDILAFELTKLVHGEEEAAKAREVSKSLFGGGADDANMPTTELTDADFVNGEIGLLDLMVKGELIASKGEGRRLIQQGGISVDSEKITDATISFSSEKIKDGIVVKKGKKIFHKFTF
jgi:tyrosyl-tRNA synthetase